MGTGIAAGLHVTAEARGELERAETVLCLGSEPVMDAWLTSLNPNTRTLAHAYAEDVPRAESYALMVEEILEPVRAGRRVCVAFYGHPGFLVRPGHGALARARAEGLAARMLPAVSALDCLVADLGVDPGDLGLQAYEATEFLVHGRRPDPTVPLVLWQLSVVGVRTGVREPDLSRLPVLVAALERVYPTDHEVVLYEASPYPVVAARVERIALRKLASARVSAMSSLYVPPAAPPGADDEMASRLGLE